MQFKVVVADALAETGMGVLREQCKVVLTVDQPRATLLSELADAEALVVRSATQVDSEIIEAAPILRVIGRAGGGVDNIDLAAATKHGVMVVNAPAANVISAAEHTWALLLAQARQIPRADQSVRAGHWSRSEFQGVELHGKTLGILGLGRVGSLVAERGRAFGMRVLGHDPYIAEENAKRLGVELMSDLGELLSEADVVTIHLPRTRETEGLLGRKELATMKRGSRVVNTSRGGIVDEEALAEAILEGSIAGAALDVFDSEPPESSPLFALPQVVVTPHLGASTREAQDKAGIDIAQAVLRALEGELVSSAVNLDLGPDVPEQVRNVLPLAEHLGAIFVTLTRALPSDLSVRAEGSLAADPTEAVTLAALKGALSRVTEEPVSYVNAALLAAERGLSVSSESSPDAGEYQFRIRIAAGSSSLAGTIGRSGPELVEINQHEVEIPLSPHMLIVTNEDVPGVIGLLGTYLGDENINIANMVVGRAPGSSAAALMGLNLDQPLTEEQTAGLRDLKGIREAVAVELKLSNNEVQ